MKQLNEQYNAKKLDLSKDQHLMSIRTNIKKYYEFVNENFTEKLYFIEKKIKQWNTKIKSLSNTERYEKIDEILKKANKILHGFGVEPITDENAFINKYYYDIIGLYVNMGDTYDTTLVFDTDRQKFLITSWGDFYEKWQSENSTEINENKTNKFYWIEKESLESRASAETILQIEEFDKELLQKTFDMECWKLKNGENLEYGKFDGKQYHPAILFVEKKNGRLITYNLKGYQKEYHPKYDEQGFPIFCIIP